MQIKRRTWHYKTPQMRYAEPVTLPLAITAKEFVLHLLTNGLITSTKGLEIWPNAATPIH